MSVKIIAKTLAAMMALSCLPAVAYAQQDEAQPQVQVTAAAEDLSPPEADELNTPEAESFSAKDEADTATPAEGWNTVDGKYKYYKNGSYVVNNWVKDGGRWYYMDEGGIMCTGWRNIGGTVYYFNPYGSMQSGVVTINGQSHEFASSGRYIGPKRGSSYTGWAAGAFDTWYYYVKGSIAKGWKKVGGSWYYMRSNGVMVDKDWAKVGNSWYYFHAGGRMATGWAKIDDTWYYLTPNTGAMKTGWLEKSGGWYYLKGNGAMVENCWYQVGGRWYYFRPGGLMGTGWTEIDGEWYYMKGSSGIMQTGWQKISNQWYYFRGDGVMQTGFTKIGANWYFFTAGGAMKKGWEQIDGKWFYFKSDGAMVTGKYRIGSTDYYFTVSGEWIDYGNISKGIDVSSYQSNINWKEVKASGMCDFALLRALRCEPTAGPNGTPRYSIDTTFEKNVREAKKEGIKIGAYILTYAFNREEMKKEVELFVNSAEVQRLKADGITFDFPIFIDIEYSGIITGNPSKESRTDVLRYGMDLLRQYGYKPGFYSNMNWANNYYNAAQLSSEGYYFWLARYPGDVYQKPENKPALSSVNNALYQIWQYTSQGAVSGISGLVDLNFGYTNF